MVILVRLLLSEFTSSRSQTHNHARVFPKWSHTKVLFFFFFWSLQSVFYFHQHLKRMSELHTAQDCPSMVRYRNWFLKCSKWKFTLMFGVSNLFKNILILLFNKVTLNWSKVKVKILVLLQNCSNKCCSSEVCSSKHPGKSVTQNWKLYMAT